MMDSTQDAGHVFAGAPVRRGVTAMAGRLRGGLRERALPSRSSTVVRGLLAGLALFALYVITDCALPYEPSGGARLHSRLLDDLRASGWAQPSVIVYDHSLVGPGEVTTPADAD